MNLAEIETVDNTSLCKFKKWAKTSAKKIRAEVTQI